MTNIMEQGLAMIEAEGGFDTLRDRMAEFHNAAARMRRERPTLMNDHPNNWVAMGPDGVLAIGHSFDSVLEELDSRGESESEFVIDFLDTAPPTLIL